MYDGAGCLLEQAAAFGAGALDALTFGLSSVVLGAAVPGYGEFVAGQAAAFTAGGVTATVIQTVVAVVGTLGAATGLAIGLIAVKIAAKAAIKAEAKAVERAAVHSAERGAAKELELFYPRNNGFAGAADDTFVNVGQRIDRRGGGPQSQFFSPEGTPTGARSLPPGVATQRLRTFEVLKPIPVQSGRVAPAFGQAGGGLQFRTPVGVGVLLKRGFLREV